jgi:hypothetical protein
MISPRQDHTVGINAHTRKKGDKFVDRVFLSPPDPAGVQNVGTEEDEAMSTDEEPDKSFHPSNTSVIPISRIRA